MPFGASKIVFGTFWSWVPHLQSMCSAPAQAHDSLGRPNSIRTGFGTLGEVFANHMVHPRSLSGLFWSYMANKLISISRKLLTADFQLRSVSNYLFTGAPLGIYVSKFWNQLRVQPAMTCEHGPINDIVVSIVLAAARLGCTPCS